MEVIEKVKPVNSARINSGWECKQAKPLLLIFMGAWISLLSSCIVVADHPRHGWHRWHHGEEHREGEHREGGEHR